MKSVSNMSHEEIKEKSKRPEGFSAYKYAESHFNIRAKVRDLVQQGELVKSEEHRDKVVYKFAGAIQ